MVADGSGVRDLDDGEAAHRLARAAAAVAEDASCVGEWRVGQLRAEAGPGVTADQARRALAECGVRVAELPRLPAGTPEMFSRHPEFANAVARLGHQLSVQAAFAASGSGDLHVLDGIRLGEGSPLDQAAIESMRLLARPGPQVEDQNRVLSALADAAGQPDGLTTVVFWEIARELRPLAGLGYPQIVIAEQARHLLPLTRDEAEVFAAAVTEERQRRELPGHVRYGQAELTEAPAVQPPSAQAAVAPAGLAPPPAQPLSPVTDLQVRPVRGRTDVVQLSWSPPATGVVKLRMAAERPPWREGEGLAPGAADTYGQMLCGPSVLGPDHRMSCEIPRPQKRTFVTPVTVGPGDARVGRTVELARDAPVQGLSYRRFGSEVRLDWVWPGDSPFASVAWETTASAAKQGPDRPQRKERTVSQRAFKDEGGFAATMGYAEQRVQVWAAIRADDGTEEWTDAAAITVPGIPAPVHWNFLPVPRSLSGRLGLQRQRLLELAPDEPCQLPDLVVIESRREALPLRPEDGEVVKRISGRHLDPVAPLRELIVLERNRSGWIVCFIDPARPGRDLVTLIGPSVERQRW